MKLFLFVTLILSINITFSQELASFKVKSLKYKSNTGSVSFDLEFWNDSNDTIIILKPEPRFFEGNYSRSSSPVLGISSPPYSIIVSESTDCKNNSIERMVADFQGYSSLHKGMFVAIPPGTSQNLGSVKLLLREFNFCVESTYSFQLTYNFQPIKIDEKLKEDIVNKINDIENAITEVNDLIKEIPPVSNKVSLGSSQLKMTLNSIKNSESLYSSIVKSNVVVGLEY